MIEIKLDGMKLGEITHDGMELYTNIYMGGDFWRNHDDSKGSFWASPISMLICQPFQCIFCYLQGDKESLSVLTKEQRIIAAQAITIPLMESIDFVIRELTKSTEFDKRITITLVTKPIDNTMISW